MISTSWGETIITSKHRGLDENLETKSHLAALYRKMRVLNPYLSMRSKNAHSQHISGELRPVGSHVEDKNALEAVHVNDFT